MKPAVGDSSSNRGPRGKTFLRRLSSSGLWAAVGRISGTLGHLLLLIVVGRILPRGDGGAYVACYATVMLGSMLAMFGLKPAIIRTIRPAMEAGATQAVRRFIARCAIVSAVCAVLVSLGLVLLATRMGDAFSGGHLLPHLPWIIAWLVVTAASQLLGDIYRGLQCFRWGTFIGGESGGLLANPLLVVLLILLSFRWDLTLATVLGLHVLIGWSLFTIATIGLWRATSEGNSEGVPTSHPATTQATVPWIINESWPNLISHVFAHGIAHIGILVLASIVSEHDVESFGLIRRLMVLVGAPLQLLNVALSPFVVELHTQQRIRELQSLLRVTATLAAIPSFAALAVILAFPGTILGIINPDYLSAKVPLMVLAASNLVFVLCGSNTLTLRMTGRHMVSMSNGLITGAVYLVVLPIIIDRYGILGAAGAAAALLVVRNVASTLLVRMYVGVWSVPLVWPTDFFRELSQLRRYRAAAKSI